MTLDSPIFKVEVKTYGKIYTYNIKEQKFVSFVFLVG